LRTHLTNPISRILHSIQKLFQTKFWG
jgi:hypothetical protein